MSDRRFGVLFIGIGLVLAGQGACGSPATTTGTGGEGGTSSSHAASSTSIVTTGTGMTTGHLGAACLADADCGGGGLTCTLPSASDPVLGGGPAGGICSTGCGSDADCAGTDSACYKPQSTQPGICVLTCTIGPALMYINDDLDPGKCLGRNDLRCAPTGSGGTGLCLPTCGSDSQCPAGRTCDERKAVCVDTASTGKPDGASCDPKATAPECAGICVGFTSGETICSRDCVLGGNSMDPMDTPNCGGVTEGICVFRPSKHGAGDQGYCSPACKAHDECQNPTFWCSPVGGLTGMGVDNGFCFIATPCPNGASDCAAIKDTTCTDTKFGPRCLKPGFPLGSAAPVDAGTDSGTGTGGSGTGGSGTGGSGTGGSGTGGTGGGP
jgi:hypothetical protein